MLTHPGREAHSVGVLRARLLSTPGLPVLGLVVLA